MKLPDPEALPQGVDLRIVLRDLGVDQAAIDAAAAVGRLELLAMEQVALSGTARYDEAEVAERVGAPIEVSRTFWRALGFPQPEPDEKVFTDDDVTMMRDVVSVLSADEIDDEISIEITRVIGSAMARIALAQIDAVEAALRDREARDPADVDAAPVLRSASFLPLMPDVFAYVWRRHLAAGARARLALAEGDQDEADVVVGFADLVGYTALSQQLSDIELADVVQRFEAIAYDTVSALGGRVVKLIGDGVMFAADDVEDAVEIALELAERYRDDQDLSDVRVGLAVGPALRRDGDLYGPTVNLASRIVNVAYPGTVLVGERLREALEGDEAYELKKVKSHNLKDIGRTRLWRLSRAEVADDDEDGEASDEGEALSEEERAKAEDRAARRREKEARRAEREAERERRRAERAASGEPSPVVAVGGQVAKMIGDSVILAAAAALDPDEGGDEEERRRRAKEKRDARRALMEERRARRRRAEG